MQRKKKNHTTARAVEVPENQTSRRGFLNALWVALGLVALGELLWMALSFMRPKKEVASKDLAGAMMSAGTIDSFAAGSVTAFQRGPFYLVRLEDGGLLALSCKCTHLGCTVPWVEKEKKFICPCHASTFDMTGNVLSGPASRPLDLCPITIENNVVKVDAGRRLKRSFFRPDQVTYAKNVK
jgi:cytochrome b6-f complex iron-sulfur subunit